MVFLAKSYDFSKLQSNPFFVLEKYCCSIIALEEGYKALFISDKEKFDRSEKDWSKLSKGLCKANLVNF